MKQLNWRRGLIVFLLYFALALLITAPTVLSPTTQFMGGDTSDAYEQVRHVWWFKEALQTGQSPFWQSNLGYPEGFSGVSLQADTLQFFPMWLFAFVMPLALAYNLGIWLTMALNGLAFYVLAKDRTGSDWGAFIGGVIYLAAPIMQGHLFEGHAGLLVQWPAPLYLYGLFHLVESEKLSWRWLLWCIVCCFFVPSGHMLQAIFFLLPVTGLFLLARLWIKDWRGAQRVVLVGVISGILLFIFLLPLIRETLAADSYTEAGGFVRYSADLFSAVSPSFMHPLYKHLPDVTALIGREASDKYVPYPAFVIGDNLGEGTLYIGIVAGILAIIGLWRHKNTRWWALLALITWILALGPFLKVFGRPVSLVIDGRITYITLPVALFQNLPGFSLARTPGRYGFALSFALAMMAAYGVAALWQRWGNRSKQAFIACGVVTLLIVADFQMLWPMPTRPANLPQAVYDLQTDSSIRAVYNIPYDHYLNAKDALYFQTAHEKPLIAGHVTRSTPVSLAKLELLQYTLDPALLNVSGADVIIFHKNRARQIRKYDILLDLLTAKFPPPFYEDSEIAMYRTPGDTPPPDFTGRPPDGTFVSEAHEAFYAPEPGWYVFDAELTSYGRTINIMLDEQLLRTIRLNGTQRITIPVPIESKGFYSVRVVLDPPCPQTDSAALSCRNASVSKASITPLDQPFTYSLLAYDGVVLDSELIVLEGDTLAVYLDWHFSKAIRAEDVRFVHILAEDGQNVGQQDGAPGTFAPDSRYPEVVRLDISTLPPGRYSVRAGWYASETLTRFAVQTPNLIGGQDNAPEIGTFTVTR